MTTVAEALLAGLKAQLSVHGIKATPSTGGEVLCHITTAEDLNDPTESMQAKQPLYTRVSCVAGQVATPRSVTSFVETVSGKTHTVLRYAEDILGIRDEWICERQRT